MDGVERERFELNQGAAFDGYTERNQGVINNASPVTVAWVFTGTGYFEMLQFRDRGERTDERRDISRGMKERRILLDKNVGHLPAPIRRNA